MPIDPLICAAKLAHEAGLTDPIEYYARLVVDAFADAMFRSGGMVPEFAEKLQLTIHQKEGFLANAFGGDRSLLRAWLIEEAWRKRAVGMS